MVGILAVFAVAVPLRAQELDLRFGAGVAVPVAEAGDRFEAGPTAMLSLETHLNRALMLRLDLEGSRLPGSFRDLRTIGLAVNGVRRFSGDVYAAYLLAGIGAYRLQRIGDRPSVYGTTVGLQAGLGIDAELWERIAPFAEVRTVLHLTDYGASDFRPTRFWPVLVGVKVDLPHD